ncbi:cyclic nucleotide-binding-like protein [Lipomyces japonicus]|uniref:cyclic nucleotide-binding-like protein n=1 Tax=Lipomyces japonicus TaxID=56871 RepID=UPI0034CF1F2F
MTTQAHPIFSSLFSFQAGSSSESATDNGTITNTTTTNASSNSSTSTSQPPDTPVEAIALALANIDTAVDSELDENTVPPIAPSHLPPSSPSSSSSAHPAASLHDLPTNFNPNRRISVSGESLSSARYASSSFRPRVVPKTVDQMSRLNRIIAQNFLFRGLDEEAVHTVLNVLEEKKIAAGVTIITQGDEGETFYLLESGTVDFYKNKVKVSSAGAGTSFGELALMYNAPRAATVVATSPSVLWLLDGITFRRILMERTASKRDMYGQFLREVPVLQSLSDWERAKIADALKAVTAEAGDVIITEGDVGEHFYLIEEGEAEVVKRDEGKVMDAGKGDYFGELALLNDAPRAASVIAKTKVKLVTLDKSGFQRLLGNVPLKTY